MVPYHAPVNGWETMDLGRDYKGPRPLLFVFALAFLFETWIWGSMVAAVEFIAARVPWAPLKARARDLINRAPAIVAVLLFGVPLAAMEFGSFISVVLMALGHVIVGALMYALMKLLGVSLVAVIYDLTREKLMTLGWFVILHAKFEMFHEFAGKLVKPYRDAAMAYSREAREWAGASFMRWVRGQG